MEILRSVQHNWITQMFDCNPNMVEFYASMGMFTHGGYDYACPLGTPILWNCNLPAETIYNEVDSAGGLGCSVLVKFEEEERVFKFRFWHLSKFGSFQGEPLKKGMLIGWSGNSGRSTGPHLHFDVKELKPNPTGKYAGLGDRYDQMYPNNGTFGTIRIDEWMENTYVFDTLTFIEKTNRLLIQLLKTIIYR